MLDCLASSYSGIEWSLKLLLIISTILQTPVVVALGLFCLPEEFQIPQGGTNETIAVKNWGCVVAVIIGLWSGLFIGLVTEYYTSHTYRPVREIAESQMQTAATGIIYGLA